MKARASRGGSRAGLAALLKRDGFATVAEAVGTELAAPAMSPRVPKLSRLPAAVGWRRPCHCTRRSTAPAFAARPAWSRAADPRAAAAGVEILRAGRQRDRRGDRDDARAQRGRAAELGHRRRRLPRPQRRQDAPARDASTAARPRRRRPTRNWFLGPDGKPLPPRQMRSPAARASACPATLRADGARPPALRQAALGDAVPAGDPARPRRLRRSRRGCTTGSRSTASTSSGWARQAYFRPRRASRSPPAPRCGIPALAATLQRIAREGPGRFYHGADAAEDRRRASTRAALNPSQMTAARLAGYQRQGAPAGLRHLSRLPHLRHGPASSGGIAVLMILKQLERFDMAALGQDSPVAWHLFAESRAARLRRPRHLSRRSRLRLGAGRGPARPRLSRRALGADLARPHAWPTSPPGTPPGAPPRAARAVQRTIPAPRDLAVVDARGQRRRGDLDDRGLLRLGRRRSTAIILNNELTDFDFVPEKDGYLVANRVEGGKRPRSSMSPTIVYGPDGKVRARDRRGRRRDDHRAGRQGDHRRDRLEAGRAGRDRAAGCSTRRATSRRSRRAPSSRRCSRRCRRSASTCRSRRSA